MGGLMVEIEKGLRYEVVIKHPHETRLLSSGIGWWEDEATIKQIPTISEIRDRGKGDFLAKAIVVLQTTWFVVQCIARHSQGLVITELELVTLAFAALNVITYILWWDKPLNVSHPIYFDLDGKRVDGPSDSVDGESSKMGWFGRIASTGRGIWADIVEELKGIPSWLDNVLLRPLWYLVLGPFKIAFSPLFDMMNQEESKSSTSVDPFYATWLGWKNQTLAYAYTCVIGVIFSGIHLIDWNFTFATPTELWLWRSSSLVLTVIPLFLTVSQVFYYYAWQEAPYPRRFKAIYAFLSVLFGRLSVFVGSPLYISARLIIIFLAFFSLRNLPDSAYQNVSWTDVIPHI